MFFSKKQDPSVRKQPPRGNRVTFGSLFNPNFGATLRPLGDSGKMLVSIIAALFASQGLFPRNHPALIPGSNVRLTLSEVLGTGWRNVSFARERLPQACMFFAVILSLVCTTLAVVLVILHLLIGTAHAQTTSACAGATCFQAPQPSTDIALGWINWLFLGRPMADDYLNQYGQVMPVGASDSLSTSTILQQVLVATLGTYSYCILIVGAIILFYHLAAMVVETAHHGVVMGRRANQVWAPIRLVTAVGLLVPFSGGLNSGQYIVLQVAAWGSGLASNIWSVFLTQLANDRYSYTPPLPPTARNIVGDTYTSQACVQAYNQIATSMGVTIPPPQIPPQGYFIGANPDGSEKWTYTPVGPGVTDGDLDLCGYYIKPAQPPTQGAETNLMNASKLINDEAFTIMQLEAMYYASPIGSGDVEYFIPISEGGSLGSGVPSNTNIDQQVADYVGNLYGGYQALPGTMANTMAAVASATTAEGWASAGSWFNTIAKLQGDLANAPRAMQYRTSAPQPGDNVNKFKFDKRSPEYELAQVMNAFQGWLNQGFGTTPPTITPTGSPYQQQLQLAEVGFQQQSGAHKSNWMDDIFQGIDRIASLNSAWQPAVKDCTGASCFTLGVQFTQANPLAEIAAFGHNNINTAYDLFDDYLQLMAASSIARTGGGIAQLFSQIPILGIFPKAFAGVANGAGEFVAAIGSVIGMATLIFFTAGFLLAFFLPLIPFYRFFFGILSWFLSLFEAIVAVPLIALAHLTPTGEDFMGEKAKTAYYFIFSIFLRPTLMVFGLITGYLVFDLAISAMNLLYMTAVSSTGGVSGGHYTLARLVYSVIYVVIIYLCCNKCFQLVEWLPSHAMDWMGGRSLHHAPMGDPMEVGGYMTFAAAALDQKIVSSAGELMKGKAGGLIAGGMQNAHPDRMDSSARGLGNAIGKLAGNEEAGNAVTTGLMDLNRGAGVVTGFAQKYGGEAVDKIVETLGKKDQGPQAVLSSLKTDQEKEDYKNAMMAMGVPKDKLNSNETFNVQMGQGAGSGGNGNNGGYGTLGLAAATGVLPLPGGVKP